MQTFMIKAIACFVILSFGVKPACAIRTFADQLIVSDRQAPQDVSFLDVDGISTRLEKYQGSFLIVKFWAPWCASCAKEMPELDKLSSEMSNKNIKVLAIANTFKGTQEIKTFYEKRDIKDLHVFVDDRSKFSRAFNIRSLPTTVFISKSGSEIARVEGPINWASVEVATWLQQYE